MPKLSPKDNKLFYSISEVAQMFDVNETLLRYWEREFPHLVPQKGARGIRHYTKDDIERIRVVYNLVKVRGLKLAAAREALKRNKEGTVQTLEVISRLRDIRKELADMRDALESM